MSPGYDDKERRKWQNPEVILRKIGLSVGFTFIDVGCGSGFFAIPAAIMVGKEGQVYGIDRNNMVIAELQEKAHRQGLQNLITTAGRAEETIVCRACADIIFYGMALHDFENALKVLKNAKLMIKPNGKLVSLDWKKIPTEYGPPVNIRFSEAQAQQIIEMAGFTVENTEDSGPYHYLIIACPTL